MKYTVTRSSGRNIIHQFSKGECTINRENWNSVDFSFSELHNSTQSRRSFIFTIRYNNFFENKFKLNQFSISGEDELKQIYDVIGQILNNPPKFDYNIGDKFELTNIKVQKSEGQCIKTTIYENVVGTILEKFSYNNIDNYTLIFDSNQMIVTDEYLNKLHKML